MSDTPTDGFPCPLCEGKGVRLRAKMGATAQRVTGTVLAPE